MGFVSHRCILIGDGSTYDKALTLFLSSWIEQGLTVLAVNGGLDVIQEARDYEYKLKSLGPSILPYTQDGYPLFDLLCIGIGTDGHVGSIYPNTQDAISSRVVVPVSDKQVKISLSLKSMLKSKYCVVSCSGKSTKAPLGKAEAMYRALESTGENASSFPASVLRQKAVWLIDEDSAVMLKQRGGKSINMRIV